MSAPILATKLYIPPPRPEVVSRPHLIKRLNDGLHRKLTLISAPAGFGKTTLLSEWVTDHEWAIAWLSLEAGDSDPLRFLTYLIAAVQTIAPDVGDRIVGPLQSPQPPHIEAVLTTLLNDMAAIPDNFLLVLDDYHLIDAQPVNDVLAFLLAHLPPQMHLVIASREDPQLPLSRFRARSQMTELRANDLRFTPDEAAEFLNTVMGLNLSAEDITTLETRTEGWIAGLQLAALSMQGDQDVSRFIQSFTGSHRLVLDYLVEEVLHQQPPHIQHFLLCTSILDHLCGPLCDAVVGHSDSTGQATLEYLERANLLVIPLDEVRYWYRYHHLFAEALHTRFMKELPDQVAERHLAASAWYEENGLWLEAIRHALAAEDFDRAADLTELAWPTIRSTRQEAWLLVLTRLKALPDAVVKRRPVLSVVYAWVLLDNGELDAVEAYLRNAERWLDATTRQGERPSGMVVADEQQFRRLPASIANARAYRAQALDDVQGTITYTQQALKLLPADDHYERGTTAALLGLAYWTSGNLAAAYQSFADGLASLQRGGGLIIRIGGTVVLAEISKAQGRLRTAVRDFERTLQLATAQAAVPRQGTPELYMGLSDLYREQGDLETARQYLRQGQAMREQASLPGHEYLWCIVQARFKVVAGDMDSAFDLLHEAERLYYQSPIPNVQPILAMKARLWIALGRLDEALAWVHQQGLSVDDDLSYLREYEHITLARLRIAQYKRSRDETAIHQATELLERLLQAAEEEERAGSMIEILLLQAIAYHAQGDISAALGPLERALTLAEPEGYVRIFVDEGPPVAALLQEAAQRGIAPPYVRRLLAALGKAQNSPSAPQTEPLTEREFDVLQLLRTDLNGPEIARELMISINTMRTHTKNIYSKLDVHSRRAAVRRAEELGLL